MRPIVLLVAIALLPLGAQSALGLPAGKDRYAQDVYDYATCTVRNNHKRSRELILADIDNATMAQKFSDLYTSKPLAFVFECHELILVEHQVIEIDPDLFRISLATVLVQKEFARVATLEFSRVAPLSHRPPEDAGKYQARFAAAHSDKQRARIKLEYDKDLTRFWLAQFGECAARKEPAVAKDWIMSDVDSTAERAAITRMSPAFAACLAEGETLTFPKSVLRGTVAINYYRLAMAKPAASTGAIN